MTCTYITLMEIKIVTVTVTTVVLPCTVLPVNYSDESSVVNDAPRWVLTMIGKTTLVAAKTGDRQTRGTKRKLRRPIGTKTAADAMQSSNQLCRYLANPAQK